MTGSGTAGDWQVEHLGTIRGVVFDVFGTLCRYGERRSPYRQLLGRQRSEGTALLRKIMCTPLSLSEAAEALGIALSREELDRIEIDLRSEIASVDLFPEVPQVLEMLKAAGYQLGVVSNLALPYGEPARRLLNGFVQAEVWSFEVGCMKPDPEIYRIAADRLGIHPKELLFIGDNPECDVRGPRAAGLKARLLDREARHSTFDSLPDLTAVLPMLLDSTSLAGGPYRQTPKKD